MPGSRWRTAFPAMPGPASNKTRLVWGHTGKRRFPRRKNFRDSLPELLTAQQFDFVFDQDAFKLQIAKKHFDGDDVPGDRSRRQFVGTEEPDEIREFRDGQLRDLPFPQPLHEPLHVASVGHHRVLCQVAFSTQVIHVGCGPAPRCIFRVQRLRFQSS